MENISRYLIVGNARSGTTVTHLALMGHPNISALNNEINVNPFFSKGFASFTFGAETKNEKTLGYQILFDAITSVNLTKNSMARGMKVALSSVKDAEILVESIKHNFPDIKIIFVERLDYLAQFGSLKRAENSGQYHSWNKQMKKVSDISINKKDFIDYVFRVKKINEIVEILKYSHEFMIFNYEEDILEGSLKNYTKLFNFLKIPIVDITWLNSSKVAPSPEIFIKNYNELLSVQEVLIKEENENKTLEYFYEKFDIVINEQSAFIKLKSYILKLIKII